MKIDRHNAPEILFRFFTTMMGLFQFFICANMVEMYMRYPHWQELVLGGFSFCFGVFVIVLGWCTTMKDNEERSNS